MSNKENDKDYYKLNTEAVESLTEAQTRTEANEEEKAKLEQDGVNPYSIDKVSRFPSWLKISFIIFWANGLVCFMILMADIGFYVRDVLDELFILSLATGLIYDVFITGGFLHFESKDKEYHKWLVMPVNPKKVWTLPVHVILAAIQVFAVYYIYVGIGKLIPGFNKNWGVESFLYGFLSLGLYMLALLVKNLIVKLINNKKNKIEA